MGLLRKAPSLEVTVNTGAFVGEAAKLVKPVWSLEPEIKYRIEITFKSKTGVEKKVFKNMYGADIDFVDDGVQRNYTRFGTFNDMAFPIADVITDMIYYDVLDPTTVAAATYFIIMFVGVSAEILRWLTFLSYFDWKQKGNTKLSDYPIVGHVACNLIHAVCCDIPIICLLTVIALNSGGLGKLGVISMFFSILNMVSGFMHCS